MKADAYLRDHLDDEEYRLLRNHLLFLILVGSYEQKLFTELRRLAISQEIPKAVEIIIRSWIIDPSRATSTQQGLIEANIVRRNRIAYARRFIGKDVVPKRPQEDNATTIAPSQLPEALLVSAREASTFGTKEPLPIPSPAQPLPDPLEPAKPLTAKTLTATELGSQFILPIIMPLEPKRGAMSILTKITQTGTNQDYPACPAKKGSFQCPYCVQVLPEDYATKSRWRYVVLLTCCYISLWDWPNPFIQRPRCPRPESIFMHLSPLSRLWQLVCYQGGVEQSHQEQTQ